MLKFKKLVSIFLVLIMVLSLGNIGVFANDTLTEEEYIDIPIIQVSEDASQEVIKAELDEAMVDTTVKSGGFVIAPFLIRSGNTSSCQLYLSWTVTGGYLLSGIAFDSLVLNNGSILFPVTYANIGGSYLSCPASAIGSVFVRTVSIPTAVSTVYSKTTGMKGYINGEGWISCLNFSGIVPFN